MSYYDYDPNYDFYYYDSYPELEEVFIEEPSFDYYIDNRKNRRRKRTILAKSLDGVLSDEDLSSKYLVPVVYAPTRVTNSNKLLECDQLSENIDVYYSDSKNIEKEARLFQKYAQPYYYASTIQEESESTTSCLEGCCMRQGVEDISHDRPVMLKSKKNEMEAPERWQEKGVKAHKLKKKGKCSHNVGTGKKTWKRIEAQGLEKPETSNSWTTLLSNSYAASKDPKIEIHKKLDEDGTNELPAKKSKSSVNVHEKSKTSVRFNVKDDDSIKDVNEHTQSNQAVRDTDKIPDDDVNNPICRGTSNVQNMAVSINDGTPEMLTWKNKSIKQDSSTTNTSKISYGRNLKSNVTIPDISDSTDITINSGEYREFLDSISKLKPENVPVERLVNYAISLSDINNNDNDIAIKQKTIANGTDSRETFLENMFRAKQADEERQYLRKSINPLVEVPLSISTKSLYIPNFVMNDLPVVQREECERHIISRKKSLFIKVFRTVADMIACFQNYAYKYVLRYILFI